MSAPEDGYDSDVDERIAVEADELGGARVVRADRNDPQRHE
jgi:hypothetical protein